MFPTRTVTFLCAVAVVSITTGLELHAGDGSAAHRLPRDTEPVAYGLRLLPRYNEKNPSNKYTFGGQVYILIKVNSITPNVTIHAKDMVIKSVAVTEYKTQTDLEVDGRKMVPEKEQLVIYVAKNLLVGRLYELKIMFQGLLRTDMTGFYRSIYRENDVTKWMAVTQFKPTYARRAFPCYDEPQYKTPFNVTLARQAYQMTLSNMPRYMTKRMDYYGFWADSFETTPPLPTYLVAAMVGEFQTSHKVKGTDVNIYTYIEHLSQTGYVMEESTSVFKTMQNYTNSSHELVKMDFLAVPDFNGNGMENWGINTYRERYLLLNDDDSKTKFKEQSTMVVQQQQSHQWFGNLVTCSWWDFLWLNEGFSRYFQYFATELIKPNWQLEELFVVEQHQTALLFDQTPRHPMTASVITSDDVQGIFDEITYNKAAAIIRMIRSTVTERNFDEPLKLYLQNYKYGVANPSHLWSVFENYYFDSGFQLSDQVPFTDFVASWTDQSGYPVINVEKVDTNKLKITQKKFSIWPSNQTAATKWYVPITYTTNSVKNFKDLKPNVWLKPQSNVKYIANPTPFTWYIFNLRSSGFYRVNYDLNNWNQLVNLLINRSHTDLHVLNRAQLIDDSFNLARAGILEYSTALNLSMYLKYEDDFVPWYTAIDCLSYVVERMRRSDNGYEYIKSYVRSLAESVYKKTETLVLQQNNTNHMTLTSWHKFSVWACYLDGQNCTTRAMENFKKWSSGEKISADMKDAALCTAIKMSNESTWQGVFNVYTTTNSTSEKDSAQLALACSRNTLVLYKYLNLVFNSTNGGAVRLQDYNDICDAMSLTPQGIEALTNFLMNNIETILRTIPTGQSIVTYTYRVLAAKAALDVEIIKLYNLKNTKGFPPNIKESFEESYVHVEQNLLWYNKYHAHINQWTGAPADPTTFPPVTTRPPAFSTTSVSSTVGSPTVYSTVGFPTVSSTVGSSTVSSTVGSPTVSSTVGSPTVTSSARPQTVSTTTGPLTNTTTASPVIKPIDSNSTTASGMTGSTTVGTPNVTALTFEQFDFDHSTYPTMTRCPNSGVRISYTGFLAIFTVVVTLTVSLKSHATL